MMYYYQLCSMYYHQLRLHVLSPNMDNIIIIIQENHQQLQRRPEQLDLERPVREDITSEYLQNNYL